MTRRPTWLSAAVIGGAIAILASSAAPVLAQESPAASAAAPAGATPEAPPAGGYSAYPTYADVDCEANTFNGQPYTGNIAKIEATDSSTVVFTLCDPDPAFLPKIAFSVFAINDADYLIAHVPDQSIVASPNGTGAYSLEEWRRGQELIFAANPEYWGEAPLSQRAVLRWSSEPGQKLIELQSGTVDGVDNPSVDDLEGIAADPALTIVPREDINVFYLGMNNTYQPFNNEKVRQAIAMGIDKQRIVDNFYADRSTAAEFFTPCALDFACSGDPFPSFDAEAAQALLAEGLAEEGLDAFPEVPISLRIVDRTYLPFPEQVAVDIQDQLQANLGITATVDVQESGTLVDNASRGLLPGFHLLGWNADYPDVTNFLNYHFGPGAGPRFGDGFPDIHAALADGGSTIDPAAREAAYAEVNSLLAQHVPTIPIASGASATAWRADVEGAHSSPLANEAFSVIGPGADDTLVFMQSGEPVGLYCADESDGESLRACEQVMESLYAYEVGGTEPVPALAEECAADEAGMVWTCTIRDGVTFHDGATLDANDVVTSYAVQWDALNPLHVGRDGTFTYFPGLWGGFLNPPPPAE
jgi:ABC-type transport system substrate-binding protein